MCKIIKKIQFNSFYFLKLLKKLNLICKKFLKNKIILIFIGKIKVILMIKIIPQIFNQVTYKFNYCRNKWLLYHFHLIWVNNKMKYTIILNVLLVLASIKLIKIQIKVQLLKKQKVFKIALMNVFIAYVILKIIMKQILKISEIRY